MQTFLQQSTVALFELASANCNETPIVKCKSTRKLSR